MTIGLALAALAACHDQPAQHKEAAHKERPVEAARPQRVALAEPVRALGRLESSEEMKLAFKSPGVVARLHVDIGDSVVAGQLLAELETTELDSALRRAEETLAKAERDARRAEELHARSLVAREMLDNARTARDMARADVDAARFNRRFAESRATAPGRVLARHVEPREVVAAGAPVLSISGETRGWLLRVQVTDRDVVRLANGAAAELRFDALPEERFAAHVARVAAQADAATATFEVELALERADARLLSGLIAQASIATAAAGEVLLVPLAALIEADEGHARLYVAIDGHARLRTVRTGALRGDGITVLEGLSASERVIVGGAAWVDDGAAIRVSEG